MSTIDFTHEFAYRYTALGEVTARATGLVALRGDGTFPTSALIALFTSEPESRTTAIALGGLPDDSAKMV